MKCEKAQELFSSYLENEIETPSLEEFEQHLSHCQTCKLECDRLNATIMMLEELPQVKTPDNFHAAVMARMEQIRREAPRRVKWWEIDWQQVFTIRVPAKALATGLAATLFVTLAVQLTPLNSVVAGWLPWSADTTNVVNVGDKDAPVPMKPWGTEACNVSSAGLSICVGVSSESDKQYAYDLRLQTDSDKAVDFEVYMMQNGKSTNNLISSESATRGQSKVVPVVVAKSENAKRSVVAKIIWTYANTKHTQYVFLPSNFDRNASGKSKSISFENERVYNVLNRVSAEYGAIVIASGNLNKSVGNLNLDAATLDQALFQSAKQSDMKRHEVTTSTYVVEPIK